MEKFEGASRVPCGTKGVTKGAMAVGGVGVTQGAMAVGGVGGKSIQLMIKVEPR